MNRARLLPAIAFLTRFPTGSSRLWGPDDIGRSTPFFPVVGAALGALTVVVWAMGWLLWPRAPLLAAGLAVIAHVLATGALHQDALADVVDGLGGAWERADVLRIMRDASVGAFGTLAIALAVVLRVATLAALPAGHWGWVLCAGALSRWAPVAAGWALPYARETPGLGRAVTDYVGVRQVSMATAVALAIGGLTVGTSIVLAFGAAVTAMLGMNWIVWRRLGGVTGDTLGATTEIVEIAVLAFAVAWVGG